MQSNLERQVDCSDLDSEISLTHLPIEQLRILQRLLPQSVLEDKEGQLQLTRLAQMLLYFRQ